MGTYLLKARCAQQCNELGFETSPEHNRGGFLTANTCGYLVQIISGSGR